MRLAPALALVVVAEVVLLALYAADALAQVGWPDGFVLVGRVLVVVAALLVAGACYQRWGSVAQAQRTPVLHAAAGASLVGGAALASSVTSAADGRLLSDSLLTTLGVAALVAAGVCLHLSTSRNA